MLTECARYFHSNSIWNKLLKGFRDKYISYGKFGGKVVLTNLKAGDIEALEGFFCNNFHGRKSVTISADKFVMALENSRFGPISPEMLLEEYFGEKLVDKKQQHRLRELERERLWQQFLEDFRDTPAFLHAQQLRELLKDRGNQELLESDCRLRMAAKVYNELPYRNGEKLYLPVFAARITGNPHYFDFGTAEGAFLYQIIRLDLELRDIVISDSQVFPLFRRHKSYLMAGIMLDDVSNYAMFCNVLAFKADGTMDMGMEGFDREGHIVQVPVAVLADWERLSCMNNEIYIVENPSIFAMLCGKYAGKRSSSYMCMNGQPRLAGIMALELLKRGGAKIFYSGDLDPEGLLIAQKLSNYYGENFNYWHMGVEDYEKCKSREVISEKRMKILDSITDPTLLPTKKAICECRLAGYQELLIGRQLNID